MSDAQKIGKEVALSTVSRNPPAVADSQFWQEGNLVSMLVKINKGFTLLRVTQALAQSRDIYC